MRIKILIKQELKQAYRTKTYYFVFLILPLLVFLFQGFMLSIEYGLGDDQQTIYLVNLDNGNGEYQMGDIFRTVLEYNINNNSYSGIYQDNLEIIQNLTTEESVIKYMFEEHITPVILIPSNFTLVYDNYSNENSSVPNIIVYSLPDTNRQAEEIQYEIDYLLSMPPFRINDYKSQTYLQRFIITKDEEQYINRLIVFTFSFFSIYLGLIAPNQVVSNFFAGEREKNTLESLLSQPIREMDILLGKYIAGSLLFSAYAIVNSIGLKLFALTIQKFDLFPTMPPFEISVYEMLIYFIMLFLTGSTAIGLGITITSFAKTKKSAEGMYMVTIAVPYIVIAMLILITGIPSGWSALYIIPWVHGNAILTKGLFPQNDMIQLITPYAWLDIIIHILFMVFFVIISFILLLVFKDRIFRLGEK